MNQVNQLIVLGECSTKLPRCLTPLLIVTKQICSNAILDIIYVCQKLGISVNLYLNTTKFIMSQFFLCGTVAYMQLVIVVSFRSFL